MKKIFFLTAWLLVVSLGLYAQSASEPTLPVDTETRKVTYTGVVPVKDANQSELYTRAKLWLFQTYDEVKVIKVDEKDAGLLIIRAYTDIPVRLSQMATIPTKQEVGYTLMLNFKDGRYKYTITNYQLISGELSGSLEQEIINQLGKPKNKGEYAAKEYTASIEAFAKVVIQSLDATLQKPVTGNNEW
jgi:hypothetical protein